jgi:fimbrial isopeptide formation D2 family protein/uncharacterized repeat protein (TIGR01451 family)
MTPQQKLRNLYRKLTQSKPLLVLVGLLGLLLLIISIAGYLNYQDAKAAQYSTITKNCVAENQAFFTSDQQVPRVLSNILSNNKSNCNTPPPAAPDCVAENTARATGSNINVVVSNNTSNPVDCATNFAIGIQKTPSAYLFEIEPTTPQNTNYTYFVDYTNGQNTPLTNVVITDVLDTRIEFIPGTCSLACTYNSGTRTLTWNIGNMTPNAVGRLTFKVNFASTHTFTLDETIPNTAVITSTEAGPEDDSAYVNVRFRNPDINITKDVAKVYHDLGEQVLYTVGFANTFNVDLTGVYITDILDPRLNFSSCTGGCTYNPTTREVRWNIGTLPIGASATRYLTVTTQGTGVINNKATIYSNQTQPDFDDTNIIVETQTEYEIKIIKSASETTVRRNDIYTYTLNYFNPSDDTALTGVVITDPITDPKINYVVGSCSNACTYNAGTKTLTWNIGNMAIGATGSVTFDVQVTNNAPLQTIFNEATIDSVETDPDQDAAVVDIIDYAIGIDKTPSAYSFEINPASPQTTNYTYYLDYTNRAATPLTNVVITDTLDNRIQYIPSSCTGAVSCAYNTTTRTLSWNVGTMAPNSSARVAFNVNFSAGYAFVTNEVVPNTAIITSTEAGPDQDKAFVNVRFTTPGIDIQKTTPQTYHSLGDQIPYTITYQNTSTQPLTGVTIRDILDPRLNFVSCSNSCTYTAATREVFWTIGNLSVGQTAVVNLVTAVQGNGVINNKVTIYSNQTQPDFDDVNIIITPKEFEIKIVKEASRNIVKAGETYTYTLNYFNPSDETALTGVVITDPITDPNITYVVGSCSNACTYSAGTKTLTWNIGNLGIGGTGTVTFDVLVNTTALPGTIFNEATIDSVETDPDTDPATVGIVINGTDIVKTASQNFFLINQFNPSATSYTYTVDFINTAGTTLSNAVVSDTLDPRIEYIPGSCAPACTYNAGTRTLTWNYNLLNDFSRGQVTFGVRFVNGYAYVPGEIVPNTATFDTDQTPPVSDDVDVEVRLLNFRASIIKDASVAQTRRNGIYTYTIQYANTSPITTLTGTTLTDILTDTKINYVPGSCSNTCAYNSGTRTLSWNLGTLAPNANGTVTFDVQVTANAPLATITNTATLDANEITPLEDSALVDILNYSLTLDKFASGSSFRINPTNPGSTSYTYTMAYSNPEVNPLTNVVLTDTLDNRIEYIAGSCSNACTYNTGTRTLTWNIGNLGAQTQGQVTFGVRFNNTYPFANGEIIPNTAIIDSAETPAVQDSVDVLVRLATPGLSIDKVSDKTLYNLGENVVYTLTYLNNGAVPLTGVVITDPLDIKLDYVSCAGSVCNYNTTTRVLTYNIGNLGVNQTATVTFVAKTNAAGLINNVATIDSNETPPDNDDAIIQVLTPNYQINIVKTASRSVVEKGNTYDYTLTYQNNTTNASLTNVVITDPLVDPKISYVANSCTNSCTYNSGTKTLTWNIGTLTPGQIGTVKFTVLVDANATIGNIDNVATIDSNETLPKEDPEVVLIREYDIAITKTASVDLLQVNNATPSASTYTYTLDYENSSINPLTNVVVSDVLTDAKINYIPASCSNSCTYDANTRTLVWNIGTLAIGQKGQVSFRVSLADNHTYLNGEIINNTATIDSTETDPANDDAVVRVVVPEYTIDILKKVNDDTALLNQELTYSFDYGNPSAVTPLTGVTITDILDTRLTYVANSCTLNCTYDANTRTLSWNIGTLAPSATGSITFKAIVNTVAQPIIPNTVVIDSIETAPKLSTVIVNTVRYNLTLQKTASKYQFEIDSSKPEKTGWTYFIDYDNQTSAPLTGVVVVDKLPTEVSYVANSCTKACTYDAATRTLTWNIGNVPAQTKGQVEFKVTLNAGQTYTHLQYITNPATIDSNETDLITDVVDVQIVFYTLTMNKQVNKEKVGRGDIVTWTINYQVPATYGTLTSAVITDVLEEKLTLVEGSCSGCIYNANNRTLTWNLGTLTPGTNANVSYKTKVNDNAAVGAIRNQAIIDTNETEPLQDAETITLVETYRTGGWAMNTVIGTLLILLGYAGYRIWKIRYIKIK